MSQAIWEATEAQNHFIGCPVYEVLYAGEKRSGKTDAFLMEPIKKFYRPAQDRYVATGQKSHAWVLFLRKEFGRLKEIMDRAKELFPQVDPESATTPGYGWAQQEKTYRFSNGMKFEFGHLEEPGSHLVYHGRQFCRVIVDECSEIPYYQAAYMQACVSVRKDTDEPYLFEHLGIRFGCNPYGPHVGWVKQRFVDRASPNTIIPEDVKLPDGRTVIRHRVFIPAYLKDNAKHIDYDSYAASLAGLPEVMKQAFLYGNWDYVPGSYFPDFDDRIHVRDNIEPPQGSRIEAGDDWGSNAPACELFYTTDGDGNLFILDELYKPGRDGPTWGKECIKKAAARGWDATQITGYMDPGAFTDPANGFPSVGQQLLDMGIIRYESDKSAGAIVAGAIELTRRLNSRTPSGIPGIVIDSRCKHLIEQIKQVRGGDEDKGEDRDEVIEPKENHAFEACRAILLANPQPAEQLDAAQEIGLWQRLTAARDRASPQNKRTDWY